jgi:hypothetical protein
MPSISTKAKKTAARAKLTIFPEDYFVIHLPSDAKEIPGEWFHQATTRFAVFIRQPDEITFVVARKKWLRMKSIFQKFEQSAPMKIVALDKALVRDTGGYPAIATVMAGAKIGATPISSFSFDHLLVPKANLPRAIRVLRGSLQGGKKS